MSKTTKLLLLLLVSIFCLAAMVRQIEAPAQHGGHAVQAVVVEDTASRTPKTAAVILSPEVAAEVAQDKIAWRVVDQAETGPDLAEVQWALTEVKTRSCTLPALAIRVGAGKPKVVPLPTAGAAVAAVLRSQAGG